MFILYAQSHIVINQLVCTELLIGVLLAGPLFY